jgi:hypothetical protein
MGDVAAQDVFRATDNAMVLPASAPGEMAACDSSRPDFILRSKMTTLKAAA